ncbi:MAG: DUF2169 domain-containing protein [Planctomycetes bacterium]|nr:DUF2169 domain-containing protein [Planctomycetota bacterium]
MGHPEIDNRTPFAFAPLFVADEELRPVLSTIVKATVRITGDGSARLAELQEAVDFAGKHHGEPGQSSVRREPEVAFTKPGTDCVLQGHAMSARPATQVDVGFRLGALTKVARVTGDRRWEPGLLGARMSPPQPFEKLPLLYERAFGGWDRTADKEEHHQCEPQNPIGTGFVAKKGRLVPGAPLPNIEDPRDLLTSQTGRVTPVGFGFTGHDWQPRAKLAGTFDASWQEGRSPRLPKDFDRRFFLAAAPGLSSPTWLLGNESVVVIGATPEGRWEFSLPGIAAPRCDVVLRTGTVQHLETHLDTVIVDADTRTLVLLWRAFTTLRNGPHDVQALTITADRIPPRS